MPTTLAELIAAGDWHPDITVEGDVSHVLRFVDLDALIPADLASLDSRVCLLIGITRQAPTAAVLTAANSLDLVLCTHNSDDRQTVTVPDLDDAMAQLSQASALRPRATLVLASLLRQTAQLGLAEGIAAEAAAYSTLLAGPEFAQWLASHGTRKATPANESERVTTALQGEVLRIRMTRKLRLNAIDSPMRAALVEAFTIAIADPSLQVHLSGEGPCFSNGGDLREFGTTPDAATAWTVRMTQHPGWYLAHIADRAHVHMHGRCVGAGVEMSAFAGHVVADFDTTFLLPELQMGLLPGAGGCVSIPRRIGRWRTLWLVLSAHTLSAEQALDWGLIDDIAAID
ncbi:MAG: enoyl-CoA hydratase/isomerase family protein [Actinomycetota bacterium]|nr:enoyl-CoA hydratase/isomerase family protein [Actinomycetota bacterium]